MVRASAMALRLCRYGNGDSMQPPTNIPIRDMIRGMPAAFDARAAGDLRAVIQFRFSGAEPGDYHLRIDNGACTFHEGLEPTANVQILAASEVWLDICYGKTDGAAAFLLGRYRAEGDIWLLMRLGKLFPTRRL